MAISCAKCGSEAVVGIRNIGKQLTKNTVIKGHDYMFVCKKHLLLEE